MAEFNRWMVRVCAALLCVLGVAALAVAESPNHAIEVKFTDPVLVPGYVLPAGSYVFETMGDFGTVTKITRADGKFVALIPVVLADRSTKVDRVRVRLSGHEIPGEVLTWSAPDGMTYAFVYRETSRADRLLAAVTHQARR